MPTRPYQHQDDVDELWEMKQQFERELGATTGNSDKQSVYDNKLSDAYRDRYIQWVDNCITEDPDCILVAEAPCSNRIVGYAFVLPDTLAMIWDAAVLNEIFVTQPYRGTGLADELISGVLTHAEQQSLPLDRIVLDVDQDNARAYQFYKRYGFETWGEMVARPL